LKFEKNEGGEIDIPSSIDWIVEDDPPGQCKLTNPNTGQVYNVKGTVADAVALIAREKAAS
jgi:hypothetical protein